jgi:NADH dehydrogenase FAD-containing subunit
MKQRVPLARPRVVIVGAGFGGLSAAKELVGAPFDVTIVDQHNYHLFQPLLYQVATAGLSPADIASPIRSILRRQENVQVILAQVSGIDAAQRQVVAEGGRRIAFDHLIVATGARHAYFGKDWAAYAPGLKTIDDATYIRLASCLPSSAPKQSLILTNCGGSSISWWWGAGRQAWRWLGRLRSWQSARSHPIFAPSIRAPRVSF